MADMRCAYCGHEYPYPGPDFPLQNWAQCKACMTSREAMERAWKQRSLSHVLLAGALGATIGFIIIAFLAFRR